MEYIYIATSPEFPGMVKIGRTDRSPEERMDELSTSDYGTPGYDGDSTWTADHVITVENNVEAERALHEHFADSRVTDSRELFYADDPAAIASESTDVVGGEILTDPESILELMSEFDSLTALGIVLSAALVLVAHEKLKEDERYQEKFDQASIWAKEQGAKVEDVWRNREHTKRAAQERAAQVKSKIETMMNDSGIASNSIVKSSTKALRGFLDKARRSD